VTGLLAAIAVIAALAGWRLLQPTIAALLAPTTPADAHKPAVSVVEVDDHHATALVAEPGKPPAGWSLTPHPHLWSSDPRLHPAARHVIIELMSDPATIGHTTSGAQLIVDQVAATAPAPITDPPPPTMDPPEPESRDGHAIRLYGPVNLDEAPRSRPRTLELITYLAFHPGATSDDIKTAIWPDHSITPSAFNNCVTAARRALGTTPDGQLHFPPASAGTYELGPTVTTDAHLLAAATATHDHTAIRALLTNLRGLPFTSSLGYHWAHEEGLDSAATETAARAAELLARHDLTVGNPQGADWAAKTGLLAAPGDRRLWRIRLLAAPGPAALELIARRIVADIGELDHELEETYKSRGGQQCFT
jgi:hypothetical protein